MLHFILAVIFTAALYLLMRAFPKFQVNALHAVIFNYYTCVATALLLMPNRVEYFQTNWGSTATLLTLALGILFVVVFVLIGLTTTKVGVAVASLSSNMSLVIPVIFGLFVFQNNNKDFTFLNYLGLILALVALALSTYQKETNTTSGLKNKWILLLPILLFLSSGTNNTLINYVSAKFYRPDQAALFTAIACTGSIVAGSTFLLFKILTAKEKVKWQSIVGGFILGVPNFLSFYYLLAALRDFGNSAAFVFPIYNVLSMLFATLMAWILFKEELSTTKKIGMAIAVIAILLISYQEILASFG